MLNITLSHLTQLHKRHRLQALHQIQLLAQHPRLPPSQIIPAALQLLTPTAGGRVGPLLLWENASLRVTLMASISIASFFFFSLLLPLGLASLVFFFQATCASSHYHSQHDTCNRFVNCIVDKHPSQTSWDNIRPWICIKLFLETAVFSLPMFYHSITTAPLPLTPICHMSTAKILT